MSGKQIKIYQISANGSANGQVLTSNGTGLYWSTETGYTGSRGTDGIVGYDGSTGFTGSSGAVGYTGSAGTGAAAGSNNQILYRDASNTLTGSDGLKYDGVSIKVNGNLESVYSNGDEGGEIYLEKPATGTTLASGITIDVYQNKLRFFENGGTNRGAYIPITSAGTGVGSDLLAAGTGYAGSKGDTGSAGATGYTGSEGFTGSKGDVGYTGSQGVVGFTGSRGPAGEFGGAAFEYIFDSDTISDVVPPGVIGFNDSPFNFSSNLYIAFSDVYSDNVATFIATIDDSTSNIKGHFSVANKSNTSNRVLFAITGSSTIHANHYHVPISYVSGDTGFTSDPANVIITFARTGDIGDQGPTGYTGSRGTDGAVGYDGSKGDIGYVGSRGYDGSQGDTGYTGSAGSEGTVGYTGSQGVGFTGSVGYVGSAGSSGLTGYNGSTGFTGSVGAGTTGYTGSAGLVATANAISQYFTADGTGAVFTLNTSVINQNNIIITVNGLVQVPVVHYSISGSTLTLNDPPFTGSVIEARNYEVGAGINTPNFTDAIVANFLMGI